MIGRALFFLLASACTTIGNDTDRLASYKAAIEADVAASEQLEASFKQQRIDLEQQIAKQAAELLELQLQLRIATTENRTALEDQTKTVSQQAEMSKGIDDIVSATKSATAQLDVILSELPGRNNERKQLSQINDPIESVGTLLSLLDNLHADATTTTLRNTELHQSNGAATTAQLVSVSHAHFIYQSTDGTTATAVQSPSDASGFRWQDELQPAIGAGVKTAIADIKAESSTSIPVDVTGTLRLDSWGAENGIGQQIQRGGPLMIPLALVAIIAAVLLLERLYVWLTQRGNSARITSALHACEEHRYQEAREQLISGRSDVSSRLLLAALDRQSEGQAAMEDSIEVCLLEEVPRLRRRLSGIAVLGGVAPLLGLLGTVTGIIQTFAVIRTSGTTDVALMAGGISQALVTTAAGLVIAIPILLLHRLLAGAMDRIIADAESQAATALTILSKKSPQESPRS